MKLVSFTVRKFRSIVDAYKLPLKDFSVLVGPNNEGKSNILKAVVIALALLSRSRRERTLKQIRYRYVMQDESSYVWERDFPVTLQKTEKDGRSELVLEFELAEPELKEFRNRTKINLESHLKLRLSPGRDEAKFDVLLQGKAKKKLAQKIEDVARFVQEKLDVQYIPAIRPADLAEEVVEQLLGRELALLENDQQYRDLLEKLEESQQPILKALGVELTKTVASFIPDVRKVSVQTGAELRRALRRSARVVIDDGNETALSLKGDGVKSLTAIALLRHSSQKAQGGRSLILAIEEPESHLHPRAVHALRGVLQEIATSSQVIITTHSPILVDRNEATRNIVVSAGYARPAEHIREVREALGVELSDNLASARVILLVEGEEDKQLLNAWLWPLSDKLAALLSNGSLALDTLNGASNLKYKASLHKSHLCAVHAFVDNDEAGRKAVEAAIAARVLDQNEYHAAICQGMNNSEIEDLVDETSYKTAVESEFGIVLDTKFMSSNKKEWSQRMRENCQAQGKLWTGSLEQQLKATVSRAAAEAGLQSLGQHRRGPIEALAVALVQRFPDIS